MSAPILLTADTLLTVEEATQHVGGRASAVVKAGVPLPVAPAGQVVPFTRGGKE